MSSYTQELQEKRRDVQRLRREVTALFSALSRILGNGETYRTVNGEMVLLRVNDEALEGAYAAIRLATENGDWPKLFSKVSE